MTYNIAELILKIIVMLVMFPVATTLLVFTLSLFTGWDTKFGVKPVPIPIIDVVRLHKGYDMQAEVVGVYVGFHFMFLQVVWGEL